MLCGFAVTGSGETWHLGFLGFLDAFGFCFLAEFVPYWILMLWFLDFGFECLFVIDFTGFWELEC